MSRNGQSFHGEHRLNTLGSIVIRARASEKIIWTVNGLSDSNLDKTHINFFEAKKLGMICGDHAPILRYQHSSYP